MDSSSTARNSYGQQTRRDERVDIAPNREYRRDRQHLFPLEDYQAALAAGGLVRSYCGIDEFVRQRDSDCVDEVATTEPEDCVTCVDLWRGLPRVRLRAPPAGAPATAPSAAAADSCAPSRRDTGAGVPGALAT